LQVPLLPLPFFPPSYGEWVEVPPFFFPPFEKKNKADTLEIVHLQKSGPPSSSPFSPLPRKSLPFFSFLSHSLQLQEKNFSELKEEIRANGRAKFPLFPPPFSFPLSFSSNRCAYYLFFSPPLFSEKRHRRLPNTAWQCASPFFPSSL